jgi:type I restriction enzyme S subunit
MIKEIELGEIATFSQGQQVSIPDQKKDYFEDSDVFLRIINYTQKSKDYRYISKQNPKYHVSMDDIIMVRYGAVGFVGRGLEGVLANNLFKISVDKNTVSSDYLYRVLWSDSVQKQLLNASQSTSMAAINFKTVSKVKIPLPPLPQQQKIAAILDAADELRQNDKALIAKYDELTQALFLDMFGDPRMNCNKFTCKVMDDIANKITDGDHLTPKREEAGYKLLSCRNVKNGYIDFSPGVDYVGESEFKRMYKRCNPEKGDILISCSGTIGRTTSIKTDEPFVLVRSAALIKPKRDLINSLYLELYLRTDFMQSTMKKSSNTSSQANLFTGPIKKLPVLLPPIELQNQFAERVVLIEEQKAIAQASLVKSEDLFNSLLQKAFKGELV